ncbi:MAG: glycosyltransferase family 4 protein [Chitinophagaceae bacterium]|nr:glycosyltransferase family 4 protein [Chitinophagaceae bacterium]
MGNNILFLLHLPPPIHGSSIVGEQIKNSIKVNSQFSCSYINLLTSSSVGESGIFSFRKIFKGIQLWFKILFRLIQKRPDLCYFALTTTGFAFYRDVLLTGILKVFRVKRIYHLHKKGVKAASQKPFRKGFYNFVFQGSDVILLSEMLYSDIEYFVTKHRVHYCPNGIEDSHSRVNCDKGLKVVPKILFLSNLYELKGLLVLLDSLQQLDKRGVRYNCLIVGNEADISKERLAEELKIRELGDNVTYLGGLFGKEKESVFKDVDIFIFPTLDEAFGLVLLEAMQHCLPVVATIEGGIPDIVEDGINGFLVLKNDVKQLAEKMEKLINDEELRVSMGRAGRKKYEEKFTLSLFENRLTKILKKVLEH